MNLQLIKSNPLVQSALLFVLLTLVTIQGNSLSRQQQIDDALLLLKNRVSLDVLDLNIANELSAKVKDNITVRRYMHSLNEYLDSVKFPLKLKRIANFNYEGPFDLTVTEVRHFELKTSRTSIDVEASIVVRHFQAWTMLFPPFFTLLFYLLSQANSKKRSVTTLPVSEEQTHPAIMVIDLRDRSLYMDQSPDIKTTLANKPLCFYVAMLKYCSEQEAPQLYHNKNLPESFIELANKYFYRLLELGHSRRKRPDFDSNIDKMLSEIRTALDEILTNYPDVKCHFYPQKAQGEGSRSKLHNFALVTLSAEQFQLIGD
ncbi:hypothetical protein [Planctobacterium marinum]|uniref:hypothetical protein n=1 Tax=Planctobacterium marinum TaxID=1631968 RepID=UPI001E47B9C5|nr:hypothetical protein [Planctobacterium marinum]MCC2605054.1 hypothetical protein [Planctobacterium marinum]